MGSSCVRSTSRNCAGTHTLRSGEFTVPEGAEPSPGAFLEAYDTKHAEALLTDLPVLLPARAFEVRCRHAQCVRIATHVTPEGWTVCEDHLRAWGMKLSPMWEYHRQTFPMQYVEVEYTDGSKVKMEMRKEVPNCGSREGNAEAPGKENVSSREGNAGDEEY